MILIATKHVLLKTVIARLNKVVCTPVLELLGPVVRAVLALHAEVDVCADASIVQWLDGANVVTHAQKDLRWLVLTQ